MGVGPNGSARFDVIIAGDMTHGGDRGFRIAQEIRHYAAAGLAVGVIQATVPEAGRRIAPEVQSCVRRGLTATVDPSAEPATELFIVHAPAEISWAERPLAGVGAKRCVLVCHTRKDFGVKHIAQRLQSSAEVAWAPTNAWAREGAPASLTLAPEDWVPPMLDGSQMPAKPHSAEAKRRFGWLMSPGSVPPPASAAEIVVLDFENLPTFSLDRVTMLDGLAYFPAGDEEELPDTLIRTALARGVPVVLPGWLKPHYGNAARYCEPAEAVERLNEARRASKAEQRRRSNPVKPASRGEKQRPVMFVASNGVGIGHLSRLLAIARRMDPRTPVMFATQAQAVGAIERLGYLAEYMPSAAYVGGDFAAWDAWFRYELETLVDAYDPALVVYDGNNPSDGLIRAIAPRRDCRLAWVRRGMWGKLKSPFMDNARWFDLIVEPGELEDQPDEGITARRRDEALTVPPVRLLDEADLLPRDKAAAALGLDPAKPAALIQLGAGYNRDVVSLIDNLVAVLRKVPQLQICIAEWVNGAQSLSYWPDVTYLRGYPLSQYFRAFDFSIAAAGYNTFHEVVNFDLPTIFIPNRHPSMDDQAGRAVYAQNLQIAFELDVADLGDLPDLVTLMTDPKARNFLVGNSRTLHRANGAVEAARALTELLEVTQ